MIMSPQRLVLQPVTTSTSSSSGSNLNLPAGFASCILHLNISAASGTSPTFNLFVQDVLVPAAAIDTLLNPPTGTAVFDDYAAFTQATAAGDWLIRSQSGGTAAGNAKQDAGLSAGTVRVGPVGMLWRLKWVIAGTSPSFTWSCVGHFLF